MGEAPAEAVVAAARAGDEAAFSELVESYRRQLQVHCYRMLGSLEDSEDLVQETFLRAWRSRRSFEGQSSFRAWLYAIATNACLDALQRRRPRATLKQHLPRHRVDWAPGNEPSPQERALLQRYMDATDQGDPEAIRRLLRADALFAMPPEPRWYVGPDAIVESWLEGGFGDDSWGHLRCIPTRVNRQPAVACYVKRAGDTEYRPLALDVLRIEDGAVAEIVAFALEPLLERLGLPATL